MRVYYNYVLLILMNAMPQPFKKLKFQYIDIPLTIEQLI